MGCITREKTLIPAKTELSDPDKGHPDTLPLLHTVLAGSFFTTSAINIKMRQAAPCVRGSLSHFLYGAVCSGPSGQIMLSLDVEFGRDVDLIRDVPVSYTHLDVYKRQSVQRPRWFLSIN